VLGREKRAVTGIYLKNSHYDNNYTNSNNRCWTVAPILRRSTTVLWICRKKTGNTKCEL